MADVLMRVLSLSLSGTLVALCRATAIPPPGPTGDADSAAAPSQTPVPQTPGQKLDSFLEQGPASKIRHLGT